MRLSARPPTGLDHDEEDEARAYIQLERKRWVDTPGALDWLRRGLNEPSPTAGGPEPRRAGPSFFLNPHPEIPFTRCPECDRRTKAVRPSLVVAVEPNLLLVSDVAGRAYSRDDLLIVDRADLQAALTEQLEASYPEAVGNDSISLGVIDAADAKDAGPALTAEWAVDHVRGFRELYAYRNPLDDLAEILLDDRGLGLDLPAPAVPALPAHGAGSIFKRRR